MSPAQNVVKKLEGFFPEDMLIGGLSLRFFVMERHVRADPGVPSNLGRTAQVDILAMMVLGELSSQPCNTDAFSLVQAHTIIHRHRHPQQYTIIADRLQERLPVGAKA